MIFDHSVWIKQTSGMSCKTSCLFGNLEDCIPKATYEPSDDFETKFQKVDASDMYRTQYCYTHDCQCELDKRSDLETAGLPCWDYSLAGNRLAEEGPTIGSFLTHGKRHVAFSTPLMIVENVKDRVSPKLKHSSPLL